MTPREILDRLVAFPTVSSESNLALVDWVEDYLASHGVTCLRDYDATGRKANLYAHIGPEEPGAVILSGHTDVVPVEGQDWSTDPWTVTERDGRLYGRGTTDMKGFLALVLAAVPKMSGLARPIQLAFSYDEEVGLLGARPLARRMAADLPRAEAVLIGEPTGMRVVSGHKSCHGYEVEVKGHEVHSSLLHQGVSAIHEAARLIDWIRRRSDENRDRGPQSEADALFDPPYTTLHVGRIEGGTAHNITARKARFVIDLREVPSDMDGRHAADLELECAALDAELKARHPDAGVSLRLAAPGPGVRPEPDGAAERLARRLTGDNGTAAVSYGTDGGWFQHEGFSTVICGPGDISVAHQPDEFITLDQFRAGEAFLDRLIADRSA